MSKVYYLTNDRESESSDYDLAERFRRSGANAGNLIFQRAVLGQISGIQLLGTGEVDQAEEGADYVICLANFIRPGTGFLKDWAATGQKIV